MVLRVHARGGVCTFLHVRRSTLRADFALHMSNIGLVTHLHPFVVVTAGYGTSLRRNCYKGLLEFKTQHAEIGTGRATGFARVVTMQAARQAVRQLARRNAANLRNTRNMASDAAGTSGATEQAHLDEAMKEMSKWYVFQNREITRLVFWRVHGIWPGLESVKSFSVKS